MGQAYKKKSTPVSNPGFIIKNLKEISFILLAVIAIYLTIALFTFHQGDSGWSQAVSTGTISNSGGCARGHGLQIFFCPYSDIWDIFSHFYVFLIAGGFFNLANVKNQLIIIGLVPEYPDL